MWNIDNAGDYFGFVYIILDNNTGEFYIGSKQFYSITNPKISKKKANELYSGRGGKKKRLRVVKESDWRTYTSSSKLVNQLLEERGADNFSFEVISLHTTKQEMLLEEARIIIENFSQKNPMILNDWVRIRHRKQY